MREIKFRGQLLHEKENIWTYGYLVKEVCGDVWIFPYDDTHCNAGGDFYSDNEPGMRMVKPETVGQYTGLKDKNGREIYEGDVVRQYYRDNDGGIGLIVFAEDSAKFGIRFFDESGEAKCLFSIPGYMEQMYDESCRTVEVIGNIHDNPELLTNKR